MSNPALEPPVDLPSSPRVGLDGSSEPPSEGVPKPSDGTTGSNSDHAISVRSNRESETRLRMNFPFDENIFDSAPPEPANGSGEIPYIPSTTEELVPPPDFKPFFTLIEDPETGAYHHPSVHYIFSDDDPEILTSAVLETFDDARDGEVEPELSSNSPPPRSVTIDVAADGKTITSAASLSPEWQGLETSVGPAPSWGSDSNGADRGLMLRISGQQSIVSSDANGGSRRQRQYASVDEMLETFSRRLARLDSTLNRT